jgi:parallel beta-helix repeat protein
MGGNIMRSPAAVFPIVLALAAVSYAPRAGQAQDSRAEGPIEIEKCQTISKPGSYKLVKNLVAGTGDCLLINANFVTIDLTGFSINGGGITTTPPRFSFKGIAVRNGSISGAFIGVGLEFASNSIVEGLRVFDASDIGIVADGIVKGNIVSNAKGEGISGGGTVTGNHVSNSTRDSVAINVAAGSTVIGNTVIGNNIGLNVICPSNVTDNTAVFNNTNLLLSNPGCNDTNNVAP